MKSMVRLILILALWSAGCVARVITETTTFTASGAHDVEREFVLPGAVDLDSAQAAVVAVYARLMLPIEKSESKDGSRFRLINSKMVNLSNKDGLTYADCGEKEVEKWRETFAKDPDAFFVRESQPARLRIAAKSG